MMYGVAIGAKCRFADRARLDVLEADYVVTFLTEHKFSYPIDIIRIKW